MAKFPHPFDNEILYEPTEDGNVIIDDRGRTGLFTREGVHISGELRHSDPQMCNWVTNIPDPATQAIAGRSKTA